MAGPSWVQPDVGLEVWPSPTVSLSTDASMCGLGAVWNGTVPACGFFDAAQDCSSIDEFELLAASHEFREFASFARGKQLQLLSDSPVTVHIKCNWTSRSPRFLSNLRTLRALCEARVITLYTRNLPSVLNLRADRLPRRTDSTKIGPVTDVLSFADPSFSGPASRRRGPPAARRMRTGSTTARSPPSDVFAGLVSAPDAVWARISRRSSVVMASLIPNRAALRKHLTPRFPSHAALAVRHRALRSAAAAAASWSDAGVGFSHAFLGRGSGVAAAAALIGQSFTPSIQGAHLRHWLSFAAYCRAASRSALSASPATVFEYLGTLFAAGALRWQSIRPYVASIGSQHLRLILPDPTAHDFVKLSRRGLPLLIRAVATVLLCVQPPTRRRPRPSVWTASFILPTHRHCDTGRWSVSVFSSARGPPACWLSL
jgi:hypothetical protein